MEVINVSNNGLLQNSGFKMLHSESGLAASESVKQDTGRKFALAMFWYDRFI